MPVPREVEMPDVANDDADVEALGENVLEILEDALMLKDVLAMELDVLEGDTTRERVATLLIRPELRSEVVGEKAPDDV